MNLMGAKSTNRFTDILTVCLLVTSVSWLNAQPRITSNASSLPYRGEMIDGQTSSDTRKQDSVGSLNQLASEEIVRDIEFLGKTRFSVDLHDQTYFYDPTPVSASFVLAKDDPYEVPLEALIRIKALRRDFSAAVPTNDFWIAPLGSIEAVVNACIRDLGEPKADGTTTDVRKCSVRIQAQFDKLGESISSFASAQKFTPSEILRRRDPAPGYRVQIKIDPPSARVRVMPLLEYRKNQYFKIPLTNYRWNDLLASESDMIGWYHYRAEWPAELNGLEEGDFCITKPQAITFKPPQK